MIRALIVLALTTLPFSRALAASRPRRLRAVGSGRPSPGGGLGSDWWHARWAAPAAKSPAPAKPAPDEDDDGDDDEDERAPAPKPPPAAAPAPSTGEQYRDSPRLLGDSAPLLRRFSDERPPAPARPAPAAERLSAIPQPEEPAPTLPTGLLLGGALVAVGAALLALRPWSRRPAPRRVDWSRFADGRPIGLVRPPATGR